MIEFPIRPESQEQNIAMGRQTRIQCPHRAYFVEYLAIVEQKPFTWFGEIKLQFFNTAGVDHKRNPSAHV